MSEISSQLGMLDYVRQALNRHKGQWKEIGTAADVPYDTLSKIARGKIPEPGVLKVERLDRVLRALDEANERLNPRQDVLPLSAPIS